MLVYHHRFDDRRERYRPSMPSFEHARGARRPPADDRRRSGAARERRAGFGEWFAEHRVEALLEPRVPIVAPPRGHGYDQAGRDAAQISLTHYWNWTGLPVVALPAGLGRAAACR